MAFWAVKIEFSGPTAWFCPGPAAVKGTLAFPQTPAAFNTPFFFDESLLKS